MAQSRLVRGVATKIYTQDSGKKEVWYHETCVVEFDSDKITLRTGGWKTNTTKLRMNQASYQFHLGYQVFQKKGEWFIAWKGEDIPFYGDTEILIREGGNLK